MVAAPDSGDESALVRLEHRGSVAIVQLDRPKANTLSARLLDELLAICQDLLDDPPGAVVVWGGERTFAAGADVRELADPASAPLLVASFQRALETLAAIPRATIAAIAGFALGGGLELALACDFRVAGSSARLGMPEVLLGLIPGLGGRSASRVSSDRRGRRTSFSRDARSRWKRLSASASSTGWRRATCSLARSSSQASSRRVL